ncbi:Uncharacterized membrane protein YgdD, TMEM256/DUF423 family [Fodinibius roseus]|uniref:Uncharacterized membrane protein YgdD, TMEM256/DUF423 family n=1 Tax=Fodinibius roseus TaxID=1194090 RepID=A0A1M4W6B7_9BACT|nr:DUF423 domain-containing protein [Fodinibius roseus]SHE76766.1 Uncharacterized membrane protein YgdD, TMEM256/DUF423 family [Fodinibius roseus]
MQKLFLTIGSVAMALAVILGAFGAHSLKKILSEEMLTIFETGVTYHFYHAIGLLVIGIVARYLPDSALLSWSGWLMLAGIIVFSGSLYLLSVSGIRWLGAITPVGGLCFIASWILFAVTVWKNI